MAAGQGESFGHHTPWHNHEAEGATLDLFLLIERVEPTLGTDYYRGEPRKESTSMEPGGVHMDSCTFKTCYRLLEVQEPNEDIDVQLWGKSLTAKHAIYTYKKVTKHGDLMLAFNTVLSAHYSDLAFSNSRYEEAGWALPKSLKKIYSPRRQRQRNMNFTGCNNRNVNRFQLLGTYIT